MNTGILGATDEMRSQQYHHGTRADLNPGDLIELSNSLDVGEQGGMTTCVYLTPNLDAAIWSAELAAGDSPGRVYIVKPTGPVEDAPTLTGQTAPGNPTMAHRSRTPLWVMGAVTDWQGHAPAVLKAMQDGLARLEQLGVEPID